MEILIDRKKNRLGFDVDLIHIFSIMGSMLDR